MEATQTEVCVAVTDNGVGIPAELKRSSGLTTLAARAAEFGGEFTVAARSDGTGTTLAWCAAYPEEPASRKD